MQTILSKSVLVIFSFFLLSGNIAHSQSISATTEEGKQVILHPNGTWEYQKIRIKKLRRPSSSKKINKGKNETYGLWIDQLKWTKRRTTYVSFDLYFEHIDGDIYAATIPERIEFPLESMEEIIIENAKEGGYEDLKVINSEIVVLNNIKLLSLKIGFTVRKVPFIGSYYVYSGKKGTIQVYVWTSTNLYSQYEKDIADFMNGFVILQ